MRDQGIILLTVASILLLFNLVFYFQQKTVLKNKNKQIVSLLDESEMFLNNWKSCEAIVRQFKKEKEDAAGKSTK